MEYTVQDPRLTAEHLNTFFTNIAQKTIESNGQINEQNILPDENPDTTTLVLQPKT